MQKFNCYIKDKEELDRLFSQFDRDGARARRAGGGAHACRTAPDCACAGSGSLEETELLAILKSFAPNVTPSEGARLPRLTRPHVAAEPPLLPEPQSPPRPVNPAGLVPYCPSSAPTPPPRGLALRSRRAVHSGPLRYRRQWVHRSRGAAPHACRVEGTPSPRTGTESGPAQDRAGRVRKRGAFGPGSRSPPPCLTRR